MTREDLERIDWLAFAIADEIGPLLRGYGPDKGHHCDYRAKAQMAVDRANEIRKALRASLQESGDAG
jgi:hypothetical protein